MGGIAAFMNADDVINRVLPQFFPRDWLESAGIVSTDFPSRIRIGYVLRETDNYSYLLDEDLFGLRLSLDDLHAAALINLARLPSASISLAQVSEGAEGWISANDDNLAAARILLPNVRREFREELGGDFLFSLPHRDDCFCWSISQSSERQTMHVREALEHYLHDDYGLTPDILKCSERGFQLHFEQNVG